MSKPQLAEKIDMSKAGIYLALDKKRLSVDTLEKIAEALEVPVNVFFGEEDSESSKKLNDEIKSLKQKNYIIETIARDMQRILLDKILLDIKMLEKTTKETPEEKEIRESNFENLLSAAVEAILNFYKKPETLSAYREKLFKSRSNIEY